MDLSKKMNDKREDVLYHLDMLYLSAETLQLEHNRNQQIVILSGLIMEKITLIKALMQFGKFDLITAILQEINSLYKLDPYLSTVQISLVNSKRNFNPTGIAQLKILL